MKDAHPAETTRERLLQTAFQEFYRYGFQGGSLNRIVEESGLTKGALFHHFASKQELGYAVVEEVIRPRFEAIWIEPLERSEDPLEDTRRLLLRLADQGVAGYSLIQGCPLNNLAQEMSPLDEEFRQRLEKIYAAWRSAFEHALTRGIAAGRVRKDVASGKVAAFLVAALTGILSTAKNAQNEQLLRQAGDAVLDYLDGLRP
jgi:AcrR family transcriptional regulator